MCLGANRCEVGYTGPRCGDCALQFFRENLRCFECDPNQWLYDSLQLALLRRLTDEFQAAWVELLEEDNGVASHRDELSVSVRNQLSPVTENVVE